MKMRFFIGDGSGNVLMKSIKMIKISGVYYYKKDFKTSLDIQNFYRKIYHSANNIEEVVYYNSNHDKIHRFYLYCRLHNVFGPAHIETNKSKKDYIRKEYYINGVHCSYNEWLKNPIVVHTKREHKLKRILCTI